MWLIRVASDSLCAQGLAYIWLDHACVALLVGDSRFLAFMVSRAEG